MPTAQFNTVQELETALRALVVFKFGGEEEADVYLGSPVLANAMNSLLAAVETYWISAGDQARADRWRELYRISKAERHVAMLSSYAVTHPKWRTMSAAERLDWLKVLAAPYRIDDEGLPLFAALIG
ncbi:hypothetical protein [Kitasatospora sp. McL0602]|uniref:hypothetical protein n=1 Tax=Kitasatospora sp. McL0602 TaxID=3439530 RepID=UPI003F896B70